MRRVQGEWEEPTTEHFHISLDLARRATVKRLVLCPLAPKRPMPGEATYPPRVSFADDPASALVAFSPGEWMWRHPDGPVLRDQRRWQRLRDDVSGGDWIWPLRDTPVRTYKDPVRLVVYRPVRPVSLFKPSAQLLPDVDAWGERWSLAPLEVSAYQVLDPMRTQFMLQEAAEFTILANSEGIESACDAWGYSCPEDEDEDDGAQFYRSTADPYLWGIFARHIEQSTGS
jgi:hypothetical protein